MYTINTWQILHNFLSFSPTYLNNFYNGLENARFLLNYLCMVEPVIEVERQPSDDTWRTRDFLLLAGVKNYQMATLGLYPSHKAFWPSTKHFFFPWNTLKQPYLNFPMCVFRKPGGTRKPLIWVEIQLRTGTRTDETWGWALPLEACWENWGWKEQGHCSWEGNDGSVGNGKERSCAARAGRISRDPRAPAFQTVLPSSRKDPLSATWVISQRRTKTHYTHNRAPREHKFSSLMKLW